MRTAWSGASPLVRLAAVCLAGASLLAAAGRPAEVGNRLVHLDGDDPFHAGLNSARLTTPQWVGEPGVEAVVILAIDDLREPARYETFLRPLLERLKRRDGRAPVSIFCNALDPAHPQLAAWLKEGLSLEVHTLSHPCPLLGKAGFEAARNSYEGGIDLLARIPGNLPVAFRMPCCDSMNSPSPRFYAGLFAGRTPEGRFLSIDSSVMNLLTPADPELPAELVRDASGGERFRKYLPMATNTVTRVAMDAFTTTIENHPYPYVIGRVCWEFPPTVPSDWEAHNGHGSNRQETVEDWKAALDAIVVKQGVFTFIFHPHGWIQAGQLVEFIDYAEARHGGKVRFMTFAEAAERLTRHLLAGQPLRDPAGGDNGVRVVDVDHDGYADVLIGNGAMRRTRVWEPGARRWRETELPVTFVTAGADGAGGLDAGVRFGVTGDDGGASLVVRSETQTGAWRFRGGRWGADEALGRLLMGDLFTLREGRDQGVRLRDVTGDGRCELLVGGAGESAIYTAGGEGDAWEKLPYRLPAGTRFVDEAGRDAGLRFADVNRDGWDDVIFADGRGSSIHLFIQVPKAHLGWERGWTYEVLRARPEDPWSIPAFVKDETPRNQGAWFKSGSIWWQNERTAHLPAVVDRRSFDDLMLGPVEPAKEPLASLKAIRVRPGFRVELVVSEPLVVDPVAFDWDDRGRLWVAEMRDYPMGMDGRGAPGGVVKYLEDTDGDGDYDRAQVFLDGLKFPTGVMPWRAGVLVSAAPEIFYAEDSDGDGRADRREVILSGFAEGNQQHRINGFEHGLDNWIYAANGGSNGRIRSTKTGKTADLRGHDLRFRPDTGEFELVSGATQFGRRCDDRDRWFGNENPTWLWEYVVEDRYLARNPRLGRRAARKVLANYPEPGRVFPVSRPLPRFNWPGQENFVTSASSPTPYRDDLFGPDFATSVFVSEPAHQTVHREVLQEDGPAFRSARAADETGSEFLASADTWFRPTMLKTGPDGALYIADMYRLVIEHPEYFPDELKAHPGLRAGSDRGRIYRVYPEGATLRSIPRLAGLPRTNLLASLASSNAWERERAQQLLAATADTALVESIAALARNHSDERVRLQALSTLDLTGRLRSGHIATALQDRDGDVRALALRMAERFLRRQVEAPQDEAMRALEEGVLAAADAREQRTRLQAALTLGEWEDARAGRALGRLALADGADPWMAQAILSSALPHIGAVIEVVTETSPNLPAPGFLVELGTLAVSRGAPDALVRILERACPAEGAPVAAWHFKVLAGLLEADPERDGAWERLRTVSGTLAPRVDRVLGSARQELERAAVAESDEASREPALALLGWDPASREEDVRRLVRLLDGSASGGTQMAALDRLGRLAGKALGVELVGRWSRLMPAAKVRALEVLSARAEWSTALLEAVSMGRVAPGEIGISSQRRFREHSDVAVRDLATRVFGEHRSDRAALLKEYAGVGTLTGRPERGRELLRVHCLTCHAFRGEGTPVGPALETVADKPPASLVVAILDPSQAFESGYAGYTVRTRDGRELNGLIVEEGAAQVRLRSAGGRDEVVARADIEELSASSLSLMPEGFEAVLKPQEMADLISAFRIH